MHKEIFPVKEIPREIVFYGDYYSTQTSMILGAIADGETVIKRYNQGIETDTTISLLRQFGVSVNETDEELRIGPSESLNIAEDELLKYEGSIFPLSMIMGIIAGIGKSATLEYTAEINADIIDNIVSVLNKNGIDLFHDADEKHIIFRARTELPIEIKISSTLSYLKNCLLMFGISSGRSVIVQEIVKTAAHLQKALRKFEASIEIDDPKPVVKVDPNDPRKKIRAREVDYRREIKLTAGSKHRGQEIEVPYDTDTVNAFLTFALLRKKEIVLNDVSLASISKSYINYFRSLGAEIEVSDKRTVDGESVGTISLRAGKEIKARKTSGTQAASLIDEVPFMAVAAAVGSGTTIIRGIKEFRDWGISPFEEIARNLELMGARCGILDDGLAIEGAKELSGADFGEFDNRKIALAFFIAALTAQGRSTFDNFELIGENYPGFEVLISGGAKNYNMSRT